MITSNNIKLLIPFSASFLNHFSYLDAAVYHGVRELGEWEEKETIDILAARILRGKCYLNMGRYRFSQAEAEKVLESDPYDSTAMYILGESLYLQCKVRSILLNLLFNNSK